MAAAQSSKRVLFIVPAFTNGAGGAERVICTILRHLDRSDLECHLATVQSGTEFLKDLPDDITIHKLGVTRMRYAVPPMVALIRRLKPETVVSTVVYANVLLILARPLLPRNTRLIIREATTPFGFLKHEVTRPALWEFFYRRIYPHADRIICLTDSMQREFHEQFYIPAEKLVRIYNPVDEKSVRDYAGAEANPYKGDGPNIVAAGRLRREKGFDLLIDALPLVLRQAPGAQLTILGEGPESPALRRQARELGLGSAVHLAGFQQNPWTYFAHADLFVLPSRLEGMPNALLEALALGTPVVATECVEAIPELQALDDRIITSPPENPQALAEIMVSVLQKGKRAAQSRSEGSLRAFDPVEIAAQYKKFL
jgi:glycosyltransferase involved in cell wall biosynthesis